MPFFFWTLYKLFGLNAFHYHLVVFFIFIILIATVYQLFNLLTENKKVSLVATFIYAIWPIHFMSLSWLSTTSYILMALFQAISFIFFIQFFKNKRSNSWYISFAFFILGIFSHEFSLVLPLILFLWGFLIKRRNLFKYVLPFLLADLLFLFFRFVIYPVHTEGSYQIHLNHLVIDNFLWYVAWAFNFPEGFKDLVDQRLPLQSLKILTGSWKIVLPSLTIVLIIVNLLRENSKKVFNHLIFGASWFFWGLLPVITLVNHSYTVYLSFAGLGIIFAVAVLLKKSNNFLIYLLIVFWFIASIYNLDFTKKTHWIVNEQAVSKAYSTFASHNLPNPNIGSVILVWESDNNFQQKYGFKSSGDINVVKQSLFDQAAMQVIYNDSSIKSYYIKPNPNNQ